MAQSALAISPPVTIEWKRWAPHGATGLLFLILFWSPMTTLGRDWLQDPDAGHGLLLAPLAAYFAWKSGLAPGRRRQPVAGAVLLFMAVLLRYLSGLAAELFTMRMSLLGATAGLIVFYFGFTQLRHWWLPATLLFLSVPLPDVVLGSIALPLQFQASKMGAALLEWRYIPVRLAGNVIRLPGRTLFVTEACSGLRSLAALISLGVLIGGMWLRSPVSRVFLIAAAIPVAIVLNGVRVFLTGFLTFFVNPALGEGFMHTTEGWLIFVVAFAILAFFAWMLAHAEDGVRRLTA